MFDISDVFVSYIRYHGHPWRIPTTVRRSLRCIDTELPRRGLTSLDPMLIAEIDLLDLMEEKASLRLLAPRDIARGVFLCAKELNADGVFAVAEDLGTGEAIPRSAPNI